MKQQLKYFLFLVLISGVLSACDKDDDPQEISCDDPANPECENYDPCFGESPTSAEFVIERRWAPGVPDSLTYVGGTDKFSRGTLRFRALDQDALTYRWYLGAEQISEPIFDRNFGTQVPFGSMITVSLVVTKQLPDLNCFPNDMGRDSVTKNFFILNPCDFLVNGKFRGVYAHAPEDSITIETLFDLPSSGECTGIAFSAFNFGNSGEWYADMQYPQAINNQLYFGGSGGASPKGYLFIDEETEDVAFSYGYYNVNWEFTGKIHHE
jgi:hypothetical protein